MELLNSNSALISMKFFANGKHLAVFISVNFIVMRRTGENFKFSRKWARFRGMCQLLENIMDVDVGWFAKQKRSITCETEDGGNREVIAQPTNATLSC